jgi:hypothetical protein
MAWFNSIEATGSDDHKRNHRRKAEDMFSEHVYGVGVALAEIGPPKAYYGLQCPSCSVATEGNYHRHLSVQISVNSTRS